MIINHRKVKPCHLWFQEEKNISKGKLLSM
jgi:hypothetical protein